MTRIVVDTSGIETLEELLVALERRGADPEERRAFDEAIWAAKGTDGTVMTTDLSGFTRLTRTHGILHFLSIFRRCQQAALPLITQHGGVLLKQEADDLIGLFPDPERGLACALAIQVVCARINADRDEDDRIGLCVGIDHGRFLRLSDDAFGDPVNVAYKLGEDVAKPGEVLISARAYALALEKGFDPGGLILSGPLSVDAGHVLLEHYSLRLGG